MDAKPDKLYYDGGCPLCTAEIKQLRRRKRASLQLVNVHDLDLAPEQKEAMLTVLHYEQSDGEMIQGLDANVAAWQHTRWGFALRWLRWPLIRPVADAVYRAWANVRYERLYRRTPASRPRG